VSVAAFVLVAAGVLLLLVAAAGLFLLPDALTRQHAATKSGTLALGLILIGAAVYAGDAGWAWRVAAILALLVVTLPVASHMLAQAGRANPGAEARLPEESAPCTARSPPRSGAGGRQFAGRTACCPTGARPFGVANGPSSSPEPPAGGAFRGRDRGRKREMAADVFRS
jgi:multicomponent Na+:H+ antiporter subunit G